MSCTLKQEDIQKLKGKGFLHNKNTNQFSARVITKNGRITAEQSIAVAQAAQKFGIGIVCNTTRLTIEVPGIAFEQIPSFIQAIQSCGLDVGGTGPKIRPIVACKGSTCRFGLLDSFGLSEKIHERFYIGYRGVTLPHKFKIAVGGCPNNCVKPDLNDVGIIGQLRPNYDSSLCRGCKTCQLEVNCPIHNAKLIDGICQLDPSHCNACGRCVGKCPFGCNPTGTSGYRIYIGGHWGKEVGRGHLIKEFFQTEEEVLTMIEKIILFYKEQGKKGERFAHTIQRLGIDYVEKEIAGNAILERKNKILFND